MRNDTAHAITNVDDLPDPIASAAFKFFCRHLVALHGYWQPLTQAGEPSGGIQPFCYPGIILSIDGQWIFVTAGHTLRRIDDYLKYSNAKIVDCCLLDHFGPSPASLHGIPFNYSDAVTFPVHEVSDGLDYGLVSLNSNQQTLLAANNIVPISDKNWARQEEVEFDHHIMLGLPDVFTQGSTVSPTMMAVTQLDEVPRGVSATRYTRFIGQLDNRVDIDIKGMSGGPIFGFKKGSRDRYWVVAIQSGWMPDRKITFGCPVPIFAGIVQGAYESALQDSQGNRLSP